MKKQPTYKELEKENERLRVEIRRKEERIIWLERMLFGSKRDKAPKPSSPNEPTLFDPSQSQAGQNQKTVRIQIRRP